VSDKIYIRDLALRCIVGIYPEERSERQDVVINVTLESDLSAAQTSDRIEDTVNYKTIKKDIVRAVESSECQLIEALAGRILDCCWRDPRVHCALRAAWRWSCRARDRVEGEGHDCQAGAVSGVEGRGHR
jgi:D-erythro-7,8-dihydroneopterin triphosphate epimerase